MSFDENGWATGVVEPLSPSRAFTLISPDASARVDIARWAHQARRFFDTSLEIDPPKKYPADRTPNRDALTALVAYADTSARVAVVTVPIANAPQALAAATTAALSIGGAGMDALVAKGQRVWQVDAGDPNGDADPRAPLMVAALLASILLAPIVPPEGGVIYGVKGARERLAAMGSSGLYPRRR